MVASTRRHCCVAVLQLERIKASAMSDLLERGEADSVSQDGSDCSVHETS